MVIGTEFTTYDCIANEECAFDMKIEDTTTCRCNHFVRAFLVIIALPYVFNVTYSKKIKSLRLLYGGCGQRYTITRRYHRKFYPWFVVLRNLVLECNLLWYMLFSDTFFGINLQISVFAQLIFIWWPSCICLNLFFNLWLLIRQPSYYNYINLHWKGIGISYNCSRNSFFCKL